VAKNWHFGETFRAQFRAEFFNILNHPTSPTPMEDRTATDLTIREAETLGADAHTRHSRRQSRGRLGRPAGPCNWG